MRGRAEDHHEYVGGARQNTVVRNEDEREQLAAHASSKDENAEGL